MSMAGTKSGLNWQNVSGEAKLLLVGIPLLIWTLLPIYHLCLFAFSDKQSAFSGNIWPTNPTIRNFEIVFGQKHYFLTHFWRQLWNSVFIAGMTGILTLLIATFAAFAISRLKVRGGRTVLNMALFTYFIPAAFLAVPMFRTMGLYGLLGSQWALILAMVAIAAPYAIWVLKQASDKLPLELDEAAIMDGATAPQLFRLVAQAQANTAIAGRRLALGAADDDRPHLRPAAGSHLLRVPSLHGVRPHGGRREELSR